MIQKLFEALRPRSTEAEPEPMALAAQIETELQKELGASPMDYTAQLRSLCFNLKDRAAPSAFKALRAGSAEHEFDRIPAERHYPCGSVCKVRRSTVLPPPNFSAIDRRQARTPSSA